MKLTELRGMTEDLAGALKDTGVTTVDKLLGAVAQPKDRAELAEKLKVDARTLLELGNRADLSRIKGVGGVYSDLLEFAGVDTVAELAGRNADNLYAKIKEVAAEHDVKRVPLAEDVANWVSQAKELGRGIFY